MNCNLSDLACENYKSSPKREKNNIEPTIFYNKISDKIEKQTFVFDGSDNKKSTVYFTPHLTELVDEDFAYIRSLISANIIEFLNDCLYTTSNDFSVLAVGLGNPAFSTDSLGPETVKNIKAASKSKSGKAVYSIIPNVEMNTGIQSAFHVLSLTKSLKPDVVIVIDSLSARSLDRLAATIQISNFGLSPGSGLGRTRQRIDKDLLGIPVISIGIPTVVDLSAIMYNIEAASINKKYYVTPNEIEIVIKTGAFLLSDAINFAIWGN